MMRLRPILLFLALAVASAEKYDGPRPPKKDLVYLVHADNLIPTEVGEANQEGKKDETLYTVPSTTSSARTPMAEPIFILETETMVPDRIELHKLDVKSGHREAKVLQTRRRGGPKPLRLTVTRLDRGLYKLEAGETLENGQYALIPNGSKRVFCFEVF